MRSFKPFKARPLNPAVLDSAGDLGVPKIMKKKPTKAHNIEFRTDQRLATRHEFSQTTVPEPVPEEPISQFKARPLNYKILAQPWQAQPRAPTVTVPESPKLATRSRAESRPPPQQVCVDSAMEWLCGHPQPPCVIGRSPSSDSRPAPFRTTIHWFPLLKWNTAP